MTEPPSERPWTLLLQRTVVARASRVLGEFASDAGGALDLPGLRRMLIHSALVGVAAGAFGALFFALLELAERLLLEGLAGYVPLRAHGESLSLDLGAAPFRPWVLLFLPAIGGLAAGFTMRSAPEAKEGGTEALIDAFHRHGGMIRRRVLWVKPLASIFTLGTGGAGGREGPTMLIGGAIGSAVARLLRVGPKERRILLLAGAAAGMAAVFRTPLGAALLVVEILYRDGFETDALIPAVLSSVVSYSMIISIFGETTLFAHAPRYPFIPAHLPLYALLAFMIAGLAVLFTAALREVRRLLSRISRPWLRPAAGGLALGVLCAPAVWLVGSRVGALGEGLGLLGGGYGAAQIAITGSPLLPFGWESVEILLMLLVAKLLASSLTVGSGGSAGDFAPSLALGALLGGAFGRAAFLLLADPRIDPGAFALVGMGAFYGGIAHVPLASLVLVCELAGSYDLLVPLMLAEGIAFVLLRKRTLYHAQLPTPRDSPQHRRDALADVSRGLTVREVMHAGTAYELFSVATRAEEMIQRSAARPRQSVFPVLSAAGVLDGLVTADALHDVAREHDLRDWALAADLMQGPASVKPDLEIGAALRLMRATDLLELPVLDGGKIIGFLSEADVARLLIDASDPEPTSPDDPS